MNQEDKNENNNLMDIINKQNKIIAQLQNNVENLTNQLQETNKQLQMLQNQQNSNVQGQDTKGQEKVENSQVNEGDNNMEEKKKKFLNYINTIRRNHGLNTYNYVFCKICKEINSHYTKFCPNQICKICLKNGHSARNCKLRFTCQICREFGHTAKYCNSSKAIEIRASKYRTCLICGVRGHIAKNCGTIRHDRDFQNRENKDIEEPKEDTEEDLEKDTESGLSD